MPTTTLPRIIRFDGRTDSGEFGAANCAHCGAQGRYEFQFLCEDGHRRSAMAGCIKLYPVSPVADEHKRIIERQAERAAKGQDLASWDLTKLDAIERFYAQEATEDDTLRVIRAENLRRDEWLARKRGGRRR